MTRTAIARLCATSVILGLATSSTAFGQQDLIAEDVPVGVAQNIFELDESNFDQWVFGNTGRNGAARREMDSNLALCVGELDRACKLSDDQKKKLLLAGHGDIKHFLDRVADARRVFEQLRNDQNNIQAIFQETQPLAAMLRAGLFNSESLFSKTIGTTLDPEQAGLYRQVLLDKQQFYYRSNVAFAMARLDQSLGLTDDQHQKLTELILRETTPSKKPAGQYEVTMVYLKMSKIPEDKVRAIIDEPRWRVLKAQMQQAKGMEAFMISNGFIDPTESQSKPDPKPKSAEAKIEVIEGDGHRHE